jgi:hypothetical protein
VVTAGVERVGVVRVPPLVSVPPAEPFPPPHAARKPTANNAIIAAAPRGSNEKRAPTQTRSHPRATDPSPNRDEPRRCTHRSPCSGDVSLQVLRHRRHEARKRPATSAPS